MSGPSESAASSRAMATGRQIRGGAAAAAGLAVAVLLAAARESPPPQLGGLGGIDPATANAAELRLLPGIGPRLAERIDAHRLEWGPPRRPEDLLEVPGIGPATLRAIEPWLRFGSSMPAGGDSPSPSCRGD